MRLSRLFALAALVAAAGAAPTMVPAQPAATAACTPGAKLQFICGVRNPEDLVQIPRSDWIIGSGLSVANAPGTGGLIIIDGKTRTATKAVLQLGGPALKPFDACPGPVDPTRFSAHGLNLLAQGRGRLFVVGHGAREAIEVFSISQPRGRPPQLQWIGCIPAPQGANFNSVAALSDGRVIATDFYHAPLTMGDALAGRNTGAVYAWKPGGAFQKLPGTELPGPNGVEVTPDKRYLFVAVTGSSSTMRYELADTTKPPAVIKTDFRTDNLRWGQDGRLLLAGPGADPACRPGPGVRCPMASVVGALDPRTMKLDILLQTAEPAFQGLSSALIVGKTLWLGSYTADRAAYTSL
jgi:hypothetical protein